MNPDRPGGTSVWLLAARPGTLLAAAAPVLVGSAAALADGVAHGPAAVCAFLSAVAIQVGTNFYNDYKDHQRGADRPDRLGPVRVTQAGLVTPAQIRWATALAFGAAVAFGTYLMIRGGWPIVAIGAASIASGLLYTATRFSLAYTGWADLFVLVFFGPVAVGGTYYVQALTLPVEVIVAGLGPGLLAVAILLVNNIRDVEQDRASRKRTLVVRLGRSTGEWLYGACVALAALLPGVLVFVFETRTSVLTAVLVVPLALPVFRALRKREGRALNPILGRTAGLLMAYSVLLSLGWILPDFV